MMTYRWWPPVLLLAVASAAAAPAAARKPGSAPESEPRAAPETALVLSDGSEPHRILRGDWEAPDALVVVYRAAWKQTLSAVIGAAVGESPVYVLTGEAPLAEVERWIREEVDSREPGCQIHVLDVPTDTAWIRDYGPLQVQLGGKALWLDALYSATRPLDERVPEWLSEGLGGELEALDFPIDGGAVASNGEGLCVMTWASIEPSAQGLDGVLGRFGCRALVVVPALVDEETGHADMFVRFFSPAVVGVASMDPRVFPENAARLDEAAEVLESIAARLAVELEVVRVPMPLGQAWEFLSYLNAVRIGDRLLVPSFSSVDAGTEAGIYQLLAEASGLTLAVIPADDPIADGGAIHCFALGIFLPEAAPTRAASAPVPRSVDKVSPGADSALKASKGQKAGSARGRARHRRPGRRSRG